MELMKDVRTPPRRAITSQSAANSLPRTKDGRAISNKPNSKRGNVKIRPMTDRGIISPYPTVVIARRT